MAHTDWNQRIREEVEAIKAGGLAQPAAEPACQAQDLKGLLNTIVEQISDADRRHTDTLVQMQDRLSTMGREAHTLRAKVPPQYAAAFERIEAGMADLASRIAETGEGRPSRAEAGPSACDQSAAHDEVSLPAAEAVAAPVRAAAPALAAAALPHVMAEPPMALRTAGDAATARKRDDEAKRYPNVDTFDVIESSLPPNVSDPWDRDSADALAGVYEDGSDPYAASLDSNGHRSYTTPASMAMAVPAAIPAVDHDWLEARFSEISSRIEQSLSELRPDHAFFALNQRIDQLENHFTGLMEGTASHADVEGIRLIEAHMNEFATHLDSVHNQLVRLDEIEGQISAIAGKLEDVHQLASAGTSGEGYAPATADAPIDMDAVAKAAAEHVASRFADMRPNGDASGAIENVHGLIEQFMSESRQGDENTSMLLDTLQQAMIRLLDRVDAMEMTQHQTLQAQLAQPAQQAQQAPQDYREPMRFNAEPQRPDYASAEPELDAAVAAVASARSAHGPFSHVPGSDPRHDEMSQPQPRASAAAATPQATRSPDKIRQDFIAEARRAKQRLEAEQEDGDVTITRPVLEAAAAAAAPAAAAKPEKAEKRGDKAAKTKPAVNGKAQQSLPRLVAVGLGVLTLLGGLWYVLQGSGMLGGDMAAPAAVSAPVASEKGVSDAQPGAPAAVPETKAPSNDRSDLTPGGTTTVGEIITGDIADGATSVPLGGIAVDAQRPASVADFQRAQRTQAMAAMSTKIGQAAAKNNAIGAATPAALIPDGNAPAAAGVTAVEKNFMSKRSALDLPPVTVGPLSLRLAAANGDPSAEFEVGARLAEGKGTGQSFEEAAKWYQRSADQGFVQSQYRLGTLYERGLGVKSDLSQAETWYKRAAEQGNIKAMHNLAVLSANQNKASPDYTTAAKWFTDAAERGLSDSQFNLAVLYENGLGVTQDGKQAYKWLSLAARSGDKEAVRRRDIMKGKLTAEELAAAELLVKTYSGKVPDAMANDARSAGEAWKKNPANGQNG